MSDLHTPQRNESIATPFHVPPDEGAHFHFLNHLATVKVRGEGGVMSVVEFMAERGFGPPLHRHNDEDELFIVLEGKIAFRTGENEFIGSQGSYAFLPHATPHTFQVLSQTARFTTVTASRNGDPRFDEMVVALGESTPAPTQPVPAPIDPGRVAEICSYHGIEIVGPPPEPLD
jgi:quercetin dioxygenase-like cupin family protein